jgi:hypothetical protein
MRAILTEEQSSQLQELNTVEIQFIPCWSVLNAITIEDTEFNSIGFEKHKELVKSFNLEWVE